MTTGTVLVNTSGVSPAYSVGFTLDGGTYSVSVGLSATEDVDTVEAAVTAMVSALSNSSEYSSISVNKITSVESVSSLPISAPVSPVVLIGDVNGNLLGSGNQTVTVPESFTQDFTMAISDAPATEVNSTISVNGRQLSSSGGGSFAPGSWSFSRKFTINNENPDEYPDGYQMGTVTISVPGYTDAVLEVLNAEEQ